MPRSLFTSLTFLTSAHAAKARTIAGWTPGIRTLIYSRVLPCGCVAGVYETWSKTLLTIIDAHGPKCAMSDHELNAIV